MPTEFSTITTGTALEERLSRPTPLSVAALEKLDGDLLVLGMGGKMGPSLVRLARRSADAAGQRDRRVIGVSRFSAAGLRDDLEREGIQTIACDLLDEASRQSLPDAPNVLFMLGHKFSHGDGPSQYWAVNTWLPGVLAERYRNSRIVCFSTGNVYPFTRNDEPAPTEETPTNPIGEYAITALGRERMVEYVSRRYGTPACVLRLNYAIEARYGVLVDLAEKILTRTPIDLTTPCVNIVWQGYANAVALAAFDIVTSPARLLNLTGPGTLRVRELAEQLGQRLGVEPCFEGEEGPTALLNDARRCHEQFGLPDVGLDEMLDLTVAWLRHGGRTLGKPTKFQVRDGKF
jgi:nucleoside-diphosphate-sugar epimerase